MSIKEENLKFYIYDAMRTKEFRTKMKNNELSIVEIMNEIDDDYIEIHEDNCPRKKPNIGIQYQVIIPPLIQ